MIAVISIITKMVDSKPIRKKFHGSLLGVALGDAIGASTEGHRIAAEHEVELLASGSTPLRYPDDTHMTIGVAESLVECVGFDGAIRA